MQQFDRIISSLSFYRDLLAESCKCFSASYNQKQSPGVSLKNFSKFTEKQLRSSPLFGKIEEVQHAILLKKKFRETFRNRFSAKQLFHSLFSPYRGLITQKKSTIVLSSNYRLTHRRALFTYMIVGRGSEHPCLKSQLSRINDVGHLTSDSY